MTDTMGEFRVIASHAPVETEKTKIYANNYY